MTIRLFYAPAGVERGQPWTVVVSGTHRLASHVDVKTPAHTAHDGRRFVLEFPNARVIWHGDVAEIIPNASE